MLLSARFDKSSPHSNTFPLLTGRGRRGWGWARKRELGDENVDGGGAELGAYTGHAVICAGELVVPLVNIGGEACDQVQVLLLERAFTGLRVAGLGNQLGGWVEGNQSK